MTDDEHQAKRAKFLRHRRENAIPVAIVCTNQHEHRLAHLTAAIVFTSDEGVIEVSEVLLLRKSGSGAVVPVKPLDRWVRVPETGQSTPDALKAALAWEFSCPLCTRKPRVRKSWMVAEVTSGKKVVDVSYTEQR